MGAAAVIKDLIKPGSCLFETWDVFLPRISMNRFTYFFSALIFVVLSCGDSKETRMQRFLVQGNEKIREQEYEQAEKLFLSALRLDTCFADALNNLGTVEQRRKNYDSAIRYYSRAIRCDERFFLAYINRANAYFENKQFQQALEDAKQAEGIFPDSLPVLEMQALSYWKMRQEKNAAVIFKKILLTRTTDVFIPRPTGTPFKGRIIMERVAIFG